MSPLASTTTLCGKLCGRRCTIAVGNLMWNWRDAAFGAALAVPGVTVIVSGNESVGIPLLFGALPAAIVGLQPQRNRRWILVVIGALFAGSVLVGAVLATSALLAVIGMFVLAIGASALAASRPLGLIAMNLCVPLAGIGLSFDDVSGAVSFGLLILAGSVVAYLTSLVFPPFSAPNRPPRSTLSREQAGTYGLQLGLVAATATALGFALGVQHIGWIVGAALLVSRPSRDMAQLRSVGRVLSVLCGAVLASWLLSLQLPPWAVGLCTGAAIIGAAAMHASRWYIVPAFSTFLVFWLLLYSDGSVAAIAFRFNERILETLCGVAIAYLYGIGFSRLKPRIGRSPSPP